MSGEHSPARKRPEEAADTCKEPAGVAAVEVRWRASKPVLAAARVQPAETPEQGRAHAVTCAGARKESVRSQEESRRSREGAEASNLS